MRRDRTRALVLLRTPPLVYVGPNAAPALRGEPGVLLGAHRPRWVDVLEFEAQPAGVRRLVERRFAPRGRWDVVGLSLSAAVLSRRASHLLQELVPGDVLLTERGAKVHNGARWVEAELVTEKAIPSAT